MTQQPFNAAALRGAVDLGAIAAANQRKAATGAAGAVGPAGSRRLRRRGDRGQLPDRRDRPVDDRPGRRRPVDRPGPAVGADGRHPGQAGGRLRRRLPARPGGHRHQSGSGASVPGADAAVRRRRDLRPAGAARRRRGARGAAAADHRQAAGGRRPERRDRPGGRRARRRPRTARPVEPIEPELPTLHQAAYDAIETGDLPAAVAAYEQAIRENPADELAAVGPDQRAAHAAHRRRRPGRGAGGRGCGAGRHRGAAAGRRRRPAGGPDRRRPSTGWSRRCAPVRAPSGRRCGSGWSTSSPWSAPTTRRCAGLGSP